jgi:Peptidase family S41
MTENYQIDTLWGKERLASNLINADFDYILESMEKNYSYYSYNNQLFIKKINLLRENLKLPISRGELALQLNLIFRLFRDPHTTVNNLELTPGVLPLRIYKLKEQFLALSENNTIFEDEYPFLVAIDGQDILNWRTFAAHLQKFGSPQYSQISECSSMEKVNQIRLNQGLINNKKFIEITLADESGSQKTMLIPLIPNRSLQKNLQITAVSKNNYFYIKIPRMFDDSENLNFLEKALLESINSPALVLDFRGNFGGQRNILYLLCKFLKDESPLITNIANYRFQSEDDKNNSEGYLEDRFMFPKSSRHFNQIHKDLIDKFLMSFKPTWIPTIGNFSENHYHFITGSEIYKKFENKPICILQDEFCSSATDILLSSLKGLPGVTTFGQPSTGASGRAFGYELNKTGIGFQASTIVSYQKSGDLFDRVGVTPDVIVECTLESLVEKRDIVLSTAEAHIEAYSTN